MIARWIERHSNGEGMFWASAFLRLQMLPKVRLTAGGSCSFLLDCRTLGTLTGSRSAVAAGRVPVESTACKLAESWKPLGVCTDSAAVTFASWVDNYYTFGSSVSNAIRIAESFENELLREWRLKIKPTSRSVIGLDAQSDNEACRQKWPMHEEVEILGHIVAANCSPWPCFRRTERKMWAAYWGNCVGKQARALPLQQQCRMLNRCVQPILNFRNSRWPWTAGIADAQSRVQKRMLSHFLVVERWPCETLEVFYRRRMRSAANLAHRLGDWGTQHAVRVCNWAEHLERPHNHNSLAAILFKWHGASWLQNRRLNPDVGGALRPGTRSSSGFLHARWDEALNKARARLP